MCDRYEHLRGLPSLWIALRLSQHASDAWVDLRLSPFEVLVAPWLYGRRHACAPLADGPPQKPGPFHPDILRDNSPDTQRRLSMDPEAVSQCVKCDFPGHVALRVPLDDGLGREKPHLHGKSRSMKVCPGCWRKLFPTLSALEKVSLRQRVDGFITTFRARDPVSPAGNNETIPAGDFVRKKHFHAAFRQLQEHHQIMQMRQQIRTQFILPSGGSKTVGHCESMHLPLVTQP